MNGEQLEAVVWLLIDALHNSPGSAMSAREVSALLLRMRMLEEDITEWQAQARACSCQTCLRLEMEMDE